MKSYSATHQLCNVVLLGNLVAKPEIRYLANPVLAVTDLTLATTHRWKDKQQKNKEWTSYHHVKVVGAMVESALLHADKGDILLVRGYIANNKTKPVEIIHAEAVEHFPKGFTHSINQIICSATVSSDVKLMTSEHNRTFASFDVSIHHQAFSEHKNEIVPHHVTRPVQVWGQTAQYISEHAVENSQLVIEGRLSYANNQQKSQLIDATQVHVLPTASNS